MIARALFALAFVCSCASAQSTAGFIERAVAAQRLATGAIRAAEARGDAKGAASAVAANRDVDAATTAYLAACPLLPGNGDARPACESPAADAKLKAAVATAQKVLQPKGAK